MDSKVMAMQESAVSNKPARVTGQWCAASMVDLIVCWIASVCTSRSSRGNFRHVFVTMARRFKRKMKRRAVLRDIDQNLPFSDF